MSIWMIFLCCFACSKQGTDSTPDQSINESTTTQENAQPATSVILFFGNSLTAGYGIEPENSFPGLIERKLDSLDLSYQVINAGLSGETTASGVNRIEWVLREPVEIMVLELGANDGLRGVDPQETKKNLQKIIDTATATYPGIEIVLAGMEAPPNMGQQYISAFRDIFPDLAEENQLHLIPFLLEGVAAEPDLNLADGIHPNEQGHKIVAANVWEVLQGVISDK